MPTCGIFADTQAEPIAVYRWLDWLEKQLPFPIIRISKGNLTADSLRVRTSKTSGQNYLKATVPAFVKRADGTRGRMSRHCTMDYKIVQVRRAARDYYRKQTKPRLPITMWIGVSLDEASRRKTSNVPWIINRHPLLEKFITREECKAWMLVRGYPEPPRSACSYCPLHSDDSWIHLQRTDPEAFQAAIKYEQDLQAAVSKVPRLDGVPFLHDSLQPLDKVQFKSGGGGTFSEECQGMCGV